MGLMVGVTLVTTGVVLFVMLPILRGDWALLERTDDEITEVDARKQAALRGLRDAEYDYRSGKLDLEDYEALKSDFARQALAALEEERATVEAADPTRLPGEDSGRSKKAKRDAAKGDSSKSKKDRLEAEIAKVRNGLAEGRTCLECGHLNVKESRFCTGCGGALGRVPANAGKPVSG